MKRLGAIAVVVVLLLAAALIFSKKQGGGEEPETPEPVTVVTPDPEEQPPVADGQPVTSATIDGTLKMAGAISHGYLEAGNPQEIYASFDIEAINHEGDSRPPLNLALVIDRSGSMSGDKIVHAREAARRLVNTLNASDRLAIVSYGSDVSTDISSRQVTEANRQAMLAAIDRIEVSGGTNLSGGYERGLAEVVRSKDDKTINRVLLMSDGNANIGITHIPDLERLSRGGLQQGVSLTSMGVGLDYNEDLMTRMANEGAGNYYFIERGEAIASMFEAEMKGLTSVVARNTAVVVTLGEGVELVEVYGFPYRRQGDRVMIALAEFFSEQKKSVLAKLRATPRADGTTTELPIVSVSMSYDDVTREKPAHGALALKAVTTADEAKRAEVNEEVISRVQQVEVAQSLQQAMELYDKGDSDQAAKVLERQQRRTRQARKRYNLKKDEAAFERVEQELEETSAAITAGAAAPAPERKRMIKRKKARSNAIILDSSSF